MSTESDRESLRRRREARQRRILASGEDRLNRIKASFTESSKVTPSTVPDPAVKVADSRESTSTPIIKKTSIADEDPLVFTTPSTASNKTSEADVVKSTPTSTLSSETMGTPSHSQFFTPSLAPRTLPNGEPSSAEDPLLALRQEWQTLLAQNLSGNSTPTSESMPFNPETLLSGHPLASLLSQQTTTTQTQKPTPSWWFALRITAVGVLVMFVFYMEWLGAGMNESIMSDRFGHLKDSSPEDIYGESRLGHMPVFWYFLTAEVGLQAIRLFLNKVEQSASIPVPLQFHGGLAHRSINFLYQYKTIFTSTYDDLCLLIFFIGMYILCCSIF